MYFFHFGDPAQLWEIPLLIESQNEYSTYDEVVCQNDYRQTLTFTTATFQQQYLFFSHFTNHIRLYRNNLITVFTLLHLFLEKRIKELYLI